VGVDISKRKISYARTKSPKFIRNVHYVIADVEYLPFRDKSFNIVTLIEVLEHIPKPHFCLKEIARILKDKLIVTTPSAFAPKKNDILSMVYPIMAILDIPPRRRETFITIQNRHLWHRDFTRSELMGLLSSSFEVVHLQSFGFIVAVLIAKILKIFSLMIASKMLYCIENCLSQLPVLVIQVIPG
jgi:2-polyprenyl-3-methyl-5-hydroxy-6-metoxy-1,4-benzoquinol methylase